MLLKVSYWKTAIDILIAIFFLDLIYSIQRVDF